MRAASSIGTAPGRRGILAGIGTAHTTPRAGTPRHRGGWLARHARDSVASMDTSLSTRVREAAAVLLPGHPVLVAYAHGSRVSGRLRPSSDLDIGYDTIGYRRGERLPILVELHLASALSDVIG